MKLVKLILPCLLVVAMSAQATQASGGLGMAYLFGYGGFGGYGGRGGYAVGAYNQNLPYFSLHPPVYYGKRYTRPYGVSPFATWPQMQSNPTYAPAVHVNRVTPYSPCCAQEMINPYAPAEVVPSPVVHQPSVVRSLPVKPLVIDNPYYKETVQYTSSEAKQ